MKEKLYLNVGLVNDLIMLLILSVLEVGIGMIDPQLVLNYLNRRKFEKDPNACDEIQKKVNTYYEGGQFDFAVKFSKYLNLMMLAFFTIRLFPMAPLVALIVAFCFYWSDKYYLLRLSKLPELCTVELPLSMLRFFDLALFVWSLGNAAVDDILYGNISDWTFIMLIITGANLLLNPNYLLRKIFTFENDESNQAQLDFPEMLHQLKPKNYFQVNPVDKLKLSLHVFGKDGFLADIRLKQSDPKNMKSTLEPDAAMWEKMREEMKENNSASSPPHRKVILVTNYAIDTPMLTLPPTKQATLETKDIEIDIPERQASTEIGENMLPYPQRNLDRRPTDPPELEIPEETVNHQTDVNIRTVQRVGASLFRD